MFRKIRLALLVLRYKFASAFLKCKEKLDLTSHIRKRMGTNHYFHFNFHLEYRKTRSFGFKLGNIWYGFRFFPAKVSRKQADSVVDELAKIENDMAKPKFQMGDDTNTLYIGFCMISWVQRIDKPLDILEPYAREERLNQKASHYNDYKERDERWNS